ncbi:hypothetical protein G7Y79_00024g056060 [Physcia stellaris]|nr:hypothetical protein G7Y79_00024g056060 [Physcia stellaris]
MSSNKYSHALVMSHFQDSGILDDSHGTRTKHRSSARSPSRISHSWTIAEVLPPSKPSRSNSPGHIAEIRRKPSIHEYEKVPLSASTPDDISEHLISLSRSDSVVTQVYAPRRSSPPYERQRARQPRNSRAESGLRASITPQHEAWEPRLAARGMASPKSPRCTCGAIVQDARLQSSYFPDTMAPQKPLPNLPAVMSKSKQEHDGDAAAQVQDSTPRFELPASNSPCQMPTTEATIKPIRRMAPARSPTTITPTSDSTSISWPKPPETATMRSPSPSSEAFSDSRPLSMTDTKSRPFSSPTTPPTSPSLSSIFSFPSQKAYQDHPQDDSYNKLPIHDKDIALLPWDDPEMGPSVFCSSPPPALTYLERPPSAASSIDDATPPPISRVRRSPSASAPRPVPHRQQPQQKPRARAASSPPVARPKTSPAPPMPLQQSYGKRKPSLDVRREPTTISYHDVIAGPEPISTSERIAPPPPLSGGLIRASKEKEVEKLKWGRLRGMFGFGSGKGIGKGMGMGMGTAMGVGLAGGKRLETGFVRGLVPN